MTNVAMIISNRKSHVRFDRYLHKNPWITLIGVTHFISLDRQAVDWHYGLASRFKSSYVVTHIVRSGTQFVFCVWAYNHRSDRETCKFSIAIEANTRKNILHIPRLARTYQQGIIVIIFHVDFSVEYFPGPYISCHELAVRTTFSMQQCIVQHD